MNLVRVSLAAVLPLAVGCVTVQPVQEPAQFIPQAKPNVVVVIYNDNSEVPVSEPRMSGDTLVGTWLGLGEPVAVPLNQVQRIDALQRDKKRTTLMIVGISAVGAAGIYALVQAATSGRNACDYSYQPGTVPEGRCVGQ
jgi:hypothetical protein